MKTLFQSDWCAFFGSDGQDGDLAVPRRLPRESENDYYRRTCDGKGIEDGGWRYFFLLHGLLVKGVPDIVHEDKSTVHRQIGTVHIVQAVHGHRIDRVFPVPINADPAELEKYGLQSNNVSGGPVFHADTDGLYTDSELCVLVVTGADCPPVFVMDPVKRAIALVHSGREGTKLDIAGKAVRRLSLLTRTDPELMRAVIGPGISRDRYQLSIEEARPFRRFGPDAVRIQGTYAYLGLTQIIMQQLCSAGLPPRSVQALDECTYGPPEVWHSYRRDRHTGMIVKGQRPRANAFCAVLF